MLHHLNLLCAILVYCLQTWVPGGGGVAYICVYVDRKGLHPEMDNQIDNEM